MIPEVFFERHVIVELADNGKYKTAADLVAFARLPLVAVIRLAEVPKGFETDFASVPKGFRWLIDNDGPGIRHAAILHDFLYRERKFARSDADLLFWAAMRTANMPAWKAGLAYWAVRLFGWVYYNKL